MKIIRPNFEKRGGLVVAIAQNFRSREVLVPGFANEEAFMASLQSGKATFWSTSRHELWVKGETSGNTLWLTGMPLIDCDGDSVIYLVRTGRPACHTGEASCFYRHIGDTDKAGDLQVVESEVCSFMSCYHPNAIWQQSSKSFRQRDHSSRGYCPDCGERL